jgi:hypothetical protein
MRVTWNTNVTSPQALFSRTAGSFPDASHETNQALNQLVLGNIRNLFRQRQCSSKTPYHYQYNLGIEQRVGLRGNLRADYVGTRGLHEP